MLIDDLRLKYDRPQGYMQPAQYPLYPYESGSSYQDIKVADVLALFSSLKIEQPLYEWYVQANMRTGPMKLAPRSF